jgi:hypothetical protein
MLCAKFELDGAVFLDTATAVRIYEPTSRFEARGEVSGEQYLSSEEGKM